MEETVARRWIGHAGQGGHRMSGGIATPSERLRAGLVDSGYVTPYDAFYR